MTTLHDGPRTKVAPRPTTNEKSKPRHTGQKVAAGALVALAGGGLYLANQAGQENAPQDNQPEKGADALGEDRSGDNLTGDKLVLGDVCEQFAKPGHEAWLGAVANALQVQVNELTPCVSGTGSYNSRTGTWQNAAGQTVSVGVQPRMYDGPTGKADTLDDLEIALSAPIFKKIDGGWDGGAYDTLAGVTSVVDGELYVSVAVTDVPSGAKPPAAANAQQAGYNIAKLIA